MELRLKGVRVRLVVDEGCEGVAGGPERGDRDGGRLG